MEEIFCDLKVVEVITSTKITLTETDTNQKIEITGVPTNSILLKLDVNEAGYKKRSNYFRTHTELIHKGCDYVLILKDRQECLLIELKSERPNIKDTINQLITSKLFIAYCTKLWGYKIGNCNFELTYKNILFSEKYNRKLCNGKGLYLITLGKRYDFPKDNCNNPIEIYTPGFKKRLKLSELL